MRVDLHIHSTASDGSLPPESVIRAAAAGGLDVIALTDHDTTAGAIRASAARADDDPDLLPAIELSSTHGGEELHVLGYLIDPAHPAIARHTRAAVDRRETRMRGMIERLAALGIEIELAAVRAAAGDAPVGRPHLARALVDAGYVRTVAEAFDRFIADGGPAFLPTELLTPREAIDLVHTAGGLAVWAHPPLTTFERELPFLARWGLDGIECYRPQNSPATVRHLIAAARAHDLISTGGSDWHGIWNGELGEFHLGRPHVRELLERAGL